MQSGHPGAPRDNRECDRKGIRFEQLLQAYASDEGWLWVGEGWALGPSTCDDCGFVGTFLSAGLFGSGCMQGFPLVRHQHISTPEKDNYEPFWL